MKKIIFHSLFVTLPLLGYSQKVYNLEVKVSQPQSLSVKVTDDLSICPMAEANLQATASNGSGGYKYAWSPSNGLSSETTAKTTASPSNDTRYIVTVTDAQNCTASDTVKVSVYKPYRDTLGMLTYSDAGDKVIVAWQQTENKRIDKYEILREKETAGIYESVGTVTFGDNSYFYDYNPKVLNQAFRYKLRTYDMCGNYADSKAHRTMVLQTSYNPSVDNGINLTWNAYEGIDVKSYVVYRIGNTGMLDSITSLPGGDATLLYVDNNKNTNIQYRVGFRLNKNFDPKVKLKTDTGPFSQSFSNMSEAGIVSEATQEACKIEITPNPATTNIQVSALPATKVQATTETGAVLFEGETDINGIRQIDCATWVRGMYFIKTSSSNATHIEKILVK